MDKKIKAAALGEIMLRLSPPGAGRFLQADSYDVNFGGAEANVMLALASWGIPSAFVTRLPAHDVGQSAMNFLRRYGVDTSFISRGGDRVGIYYLENAASLRASRVIYDRAGSAFALSSPADYDWDAVFDAMDASAAYFHFSGITPALSERTAEMTLCAVREAKKRGIRVSCDVNYRAKLWSEEKAGETMSALLPYCDLVIANEEQVKNLFGVSAGESENDAIDLSLTEKTARLFMAKYSIKNAALTVRRTVNASENLFTAVAVSEKDSSYESARAPVYDIPITDRVGSGDAFAAGLIYSLINGRSMSDAVSFAAAACALKHSVPGDAAVISADEVESMKNAMNKGAAGRIER